MNIRFSVPSGDFIEHIQERKPLLMKSAAFTAGFSWCDVNEIIARSDPASEDFKLTYDGVRPKAEYVESYLDVGMLRHRLIKPVVYDYLRKGGTLIANKISNEAKVHAFSKCVADYTHRRVVSSLYVAFGTKSSHRCHWDTRDVFAVQLIGRKRWTLYEPSLEAPLYTQQSKDYEHLYPCPPDSKMDVVLEAGDVLYVPRGWWHNPLPLGEASVHLALGTFPAYAVDYLGWTLSKMSAFLPARKALLDWRQDEDTVSMLARRIAESLRDRENYDRFMDSFIGAARVESPLAIEIFADASIDGVGEHVGLRIASDASPFRRSLDCIIANGTKVNLDEQGRRIIQSIASTPGITSADLVEQHPDLDADKLRCVITELCRQDVLELIR